MGKRLRIGMVGAFALTVLSLSSASLAASAACDISKTFTPGEPSSWLLWSVMGIGISALIAAALFMIGRIIDKPELMSRSKTDLTQIIATVVILVVFESAMLLMCNLDIRSLGFGMPGTLSDAARGYFNYQYSIATKEYADTADAIMTLSALSSIYGGGSMGMVGMTLSPFSGLVTILSGLQYIMNMIMLQISIAHAQLVLLDMIESSFLTYLIPAGVVLRCFTPTRELGGILLSLGIGLFLFYPLMFAMAHLVTGERQSVGPPGASTWPSEILGIAGILAAEFLLLNPVASAIANMATGVLIANAIAVPVMFSLGTILLFVFILPAINWIIIAALIRDISKVMGEEVDVSTLARLI